MGLQICHVILSHSIKTKEVIPAGVYTDKVQADSRCVELSMQFKDFNRFEVQSTVLHIPDAFE